MSERKRVPIPIRVEPGADLPAAERSAVLEAVNQNRTLEGALLPILHAIQERIGWIPPRVLPLIAHELNLSRAEVHGVVSFYHYFRQHQPGQHVIYLCRAEACQAVGAVSLEAHAKRALGTEFHGTSGDGRYTLEPVYCLGNCASGPSLMIDRELHGRMTPERFDELIGAIGA
ncbi:MAG TPA: formate dehydrogenase subunit gamma [Steroidobacteraceae bacterium]|jgi:formate dehydrogenase subunit gamma|nr:formate dehydrogenase subunit gamma [Steroidobacteraceae bacterium]